jgi:hypothetical protein
MTSDPIDFKKVLQRRENRGMAGRFLEQYQLKLRVDQLISDLIGQPHSDADWPRYEDRMLAVTDAVIQSLCKLVGGRDELLSQVSMHADDPNFNWFEETVNLEGTLVSLSAFAAAAKRAQNDADQG